MPLAWPAARSSRAGPLGQLRRGAEQVSAFDQVALAVLARERGSQRALDLTLGQPRGQHRQPVAQIDHLVQAGAEEIVGGHRSKNSQKLTPSPSSTATTRGGVRTDCLGCRGLKRALLPISSR